MRQPLNDEDRIAFAIFPVLRTNRGQSRAARETNRKRTNATVAGIVASIERLWVRGVELTDQNVADEAGIHRSTVWRRRRQL